LVTRPNGAGRVPLAVAASRNRTHGEVKPRNLTAPTIVISVSYGEQSRGTGFEIASPDRMSSFWAVTLV